MATPHSSVEYVEPNDIFRFTSDIVGDGHSYDRSPDLEDYCIAMNIEVEISSRENGVSVDNETTTLILAWRQNGDKSSVNFMQGTRGIDGNPRLTTTYADMYTSDLIDYGTTEMLGIKSVNVEYNKTCVPVITVQFTDVRGMSLLQPTELSRDRSFMGIAGINSKNVAQAFFECFYKIPYPKFNIYLKGFYGRPVAYEVMLDKFDTNFNAREGSFDVTARFIGYMFSFMTDMSFLALLAAPYSDYVGKKYWEDQVANGKFSIPDKSGEHQMPMPTMFEIRSHWRRMIAESDEELLDSAIDEEFKKHEAEIEELTEIRKMCQNWYSTLYNTLVSKYGNDLVYAFSGKSDYTSLLVLTTPSSSTDMSEMYNQLGDDFRRTNEELYAAITNYNSKGTSFKKLSNVSLDFSSYRRHKILNYVYVDKNNNDMLTFGGVNDDCPAPKNKLVNDFLTQYDVDKKNPDKKVKNQQATYDKLKLIFNDGIDEFIDGYYIDFDYTDLSTRINALIAKSEDNEENRKKIRSKEHNRIMYGKMNWFPSIENFTKIMMAHLETFMAIMDDVVKETKGRKAESLGISVGKNGVCSDVPKGWETVPPFPRVTRQIPSDDGITKHEDTWIGDFNNGEGFKEMEMINGLFNAVDLIDQLENEDNQVLESLANSMSDLSVSGEKGGAVKFPVSPMDLYISESPYGKENDIRSDMLSMFGKIGARMFYLLALNPLRNESSDWLSDSNVSTMAAIEAQNFIDAVGEIDDKLKDGLTENGIINPKTIISVLQGGVNKARDLGLIGDDNYLPWDDEKDVTQCGLPMFSTNMWLVKYGIIKGSDKERYLYPVQMPSFSRMNRLVRLISGGNEDFGGYCVASDSFNQDKIKNYLEGNYTNAYNDLYIDDDTSFYVDQMSGASAQFEDGIYDKFTERFFDTLGQNHCLSDLQNVSLANRSRYGKKVQDSDMKVYDEPSKVLYSDNKPKNGQHYNKETGTWEPIKLDVGFVELSDNKALVSSGSFTSVSLYRTFGFEYDSEGRVKYCDNGSYDLFSSLSLGKYKLPTLDGDNNPYFDKKYMECAVFLLSLCPSLPSKFETLNFARINKKAHYVLPRYVLLQVGAVLAVYYNLKGSLDDMDIFADDLKTYITASQSIYDFLNAISPLGRLTILDYFKKWCDKNHASIFYHLSYEINQNASDFKSKYLFTDANCYYAVCENDTNSFGCFDIDNELVKSLNDELLGYVAMTAGNIGHYHKGRDSIYSSANILGNNVCEVYLKAFIDELRAAYCKEEENNSVTKIAEEPKNTTEDMKMELYRYLKQIYDKWIPSSKFEDWDVRTFFNDDSDDIGHSFKFIDSYYNKIGQKLMVNPQGIVDMVGTAINTTTMNYMLFNFLGDVYSKNKCMLMCVQNFIDLSKKEAMMEMFKPIPYNDMGMPRKHPDFVVIYPYEPSKNLNVSNSEFEDDGFMLNDDMNTPLAIRSRGEGEGERWYKIPAFGVSYGRQYQSIFKNVNVSMANQVQTEQSIMAKHNILRKATDVSSKDTVTQDLYDIYSTQSYMCKIEMMGCTWVQPTMYLVLLNIPMFRGSYMVMSVKHNMTPGNMTTEVTACRMANVSNRLVEDIFTDDMSKKSVPDYVQENGDNAYETEAKCEYKKYPIFSSDNEKAMLAELNKKVTRDMCYSDTEYRILSSWTVLDSLAKIATNEGGSDGSDVGKLQRMLVITTLYNRRVRYGGYKNYIFRHGQYDIYKLAHTNQTEDSIESVRNIFTKSPSWILSSYSATTATNKKAVIACDSSYFKRGEKVKGSDITSEKLSKIMYFANYHEYQGSQNEWVLKHPTILIQDATVGGAYGHCFNADVNEPMYWTNSNVTDTYDSDDLNKALFDALQMSLSSSKDMNTELTYKEVKGYLSASETSDKFMVITQKDGKRDKLGYVFDILLSSYYEYIRELDWIYPMNGQDVNSDPFCIRVLANDGDNNGVRKVRLIGGEENGEIFDVRTMSYDMNNCDGINKRLKVALKKRYINDSSGRAYAPKEIPQFFDDYHILEDFDMDGCDIPMETNANRQGVNSAIGQSNGNSRTSPQRGDIVKNNYNVTLAVEYLRKKAYPTYVKDKCGHCAAAVEDAIQAGFYGAKRPATTEKEPRTQYATNLHYNGILSDKKYGFTQVYPSGGTSAFCSVSDRNGGFKPIVGDIAIIGFDKNQSEYKDDKFRYHACMYDGKKWISDFNQNYMSPYGEKYEINKYPFFIYRMLS